MNKLQKILKLISEKYPTDYTKELNPALLIYDDESGRILKNAMEPAYSGYDDNVLMDFHNIAELESKLLGDSDE